MIVALPTGVNPIICAARHVPPRSDRADSSRVLWKKSIRTRNRRFQFRINESIEFSILLFGQRVTASEKLLHSIILRLGEIGVRNKALYQDRRGINHTAFL